MCLLEHCLKKIRETKALQFEEVLKKLKISQNVKITDIYRLKSNESFAKNAKSEFLPKKVEFSTRFEKGLFFQN